MTKRDYQAIAQAIYKAKPTGQLAIHMPYGSLITDDDNAILYDRGEYSVWIACITHIANAMTIDNPRFDRGRFIKACETGKA